ncbi:transposase domain-containing protein [Anaerophilus nitritogenes]|uniref:transposase domain-containing protein n=1 Tax=Anaerophilus nitritogenes TaxID=2498136 RepID=UPI00101BFABF|nr:transposase domain-containing protein [Anaerophilus nitritogenes]
MTTCSSKIFYLIIETAKKNNLNQFEYLKYLFAQLPNVNIENLEILDTLLP